jgi:hypothetical protein
MALVIGFVMAGCANVPAAAPESSADTTAAPVPGTDAAKQAAKRELQSRYVEYLRQEGYVPSIDDDGDIRFIVSEYIYFIPIDGNDPSYFQIVLGLTMDTVPLEELIGAVNSVNRSVKAAKVSIPPDRQAVIITAERILDKPDDFKAVFKRLLLVIKTAAERLFSQLNESGERRGAGSEEAKNV